MSDSENSPKIKQKKRRSASQIKPKETTASETPNIVLPDTSDTVSSSLPEINYVISYFIVAFSKEGIVSITVNDFRKIIDAGLGMIQEYVQNIHFNPNKPQYHNILYLNPRDAFGQVWDGCKWEVTKISKIIKILVHNAVVGLNKLIDDISVVVDISCGQIKEAKDILSVFEIDSKRFIYEISPSLKEILSDGRPLVCSTKQKCEIQALKRRQKILNALPLIDGLSIRPSNTENTRVSDLNARSQLEEYITRLNTGNSSKSLDE